MQKFCSKYVNFYTSFEILLSLVSQVLVRREISSGKFRLALLLFQESFFSLANSSLQLSTPTENIKRDLDSVYTSI